MAKIMLAQLSTTQNVCFGACNGLDIIDTTLLALGPKFLDNGSQPSFNGSPRNLLTSLACGQALKPTFENCSHNP